MYSIKASTDDLQNNAMILAIVEKSSLALIMSCVVRETKTRVLFSCYVHCQKTKTRRENVFTFQLCRVVMYGHISTNMYITDCLFEKP